MSKPIFQIQFLSPASVALASRALNLVEEIDRSAKHHRIGSVDQIDRFGNGCFVVSCTHRRHLGELQQLIVKSIAGHFQSDPSNVQLVNLRHL